jgi:hypothetical protein
MLWARGRVCPTRARSAHIQSTMEIVLNILWVLLALGGVAVWRTCWARERRIHRHAPWREWTAFVCALVLLFFVVSLTDDLHANLIVLEDCGASRRQVHSVSAASVWPQSDHFPTGQGFAVIPTPAYFPDLEFQPLLVSVLNSLPAPPALQAHSGRAPPVAS